GWQVLDREALWLLLARITRRKCAREKRSLLTVKRDIRKEVAAAPLDLCDEARCSVGDPGPEEVATFQDLLQWLLKQGNEVDRNIIRMRLDGVDLCTISE